MRISDWSSDVFSSELDHPSYQQHDDGQEVVEEGREAEILFDLLEQWPRGGEAGAGEPPGLQEISGGQRTHTCGKSRLRERAKEDVAEIGRGSGRARVGQKVKILVVAGSVKKKKDHN